MRAAIRPVDSDGIQRVDTSPGGASGEDGRNTTPLVTDMPDSEPELLLWPWALCTMRFGAALAIVLEAVYLTVDEARLGSHGEPVFAYRLLTIVGTLVFLALTRTEWFKRNWRTAAAGICLLALACEAAAALARGCTPPLFIMAMLVMVGASSVFPWSTRWQAIPIAGGLAVAALCNWARPMADSFTVYYWMALAAAAGFSWVAAMLGDRYRRALSDWTQALAAAHRRRLDDLAEREALTAERELALRELHESEATLRKIIEANTDIMAITRLDGSYLQVNTDFGYRAKVVGRNALDLAVWADPRDREEFVRRLMAEGSVRDMEAMFRDRDGAYRPHLMSGALIELRGERVIVSTARNISGVKETRRQLLDAREQLSARVAALEVSESRLRAEIAERERAIEERARLERRAAESEALLRRIFETSPDAIAITDAASGEMIEFNQEFTRLVGLPREEIFGRRVADLNMWVEREQMREYARRLRADNFAHNLEAQLRDRDGKISEYLISGVRVEVGSRDCIVSMTREVGALKRVQRDLMGAREQLSAQVDALRASQDRLRAEIADRREAERRVQESERKLR